MTVRRILADLPSTVHHEMAIYWDYGQTMRFPKARKPHRCEHCRWGGILPGHLYRRHTYFRQHDANPGTVPLVRRTCLACSLDYVPDVVLYAKACGTYCCATWQCVRPIGHAGDCSCREEAREEARRGGDLNGQGQG